MILSSALATLLVQEGLDRGYSCRYTKIGYFSILRSTWPLCAQIQSSGVVTSIFYFILRNVAPGKSDLSSILGATGIHVVHEYIDTALVMSYQFTFT